MTIEQEKGNCINCPFLEYNPNYDDYYCNHPLAHKEIQIIRTDTKKVSVITEICPLEKDNTLTIELI